MLPRRGLGIAGGASVTVFLLAGIGLRLAEVVRARLWIDEYLVLEIGSGATAGDVAARLRNEANPPLYYLLAHAVLKSTRDAELPLRLLSALAGTLTAVLAVGAAWRRWGAASAAVAAILISLSQVAVHYAAEIRPFALLGLATFLYLEVLDRALARPAAGWLAAEAVLVVLATSLHAYGAPLLFVGPAVALLTRREGALLRQVLVSGLSAALLVPTVLAPLWRLPRETNEYLVEIWRDRGPLSPAGVFLRDLLPTARWPSSLMPPADPVLRAAEGAAVVLAAALAGVALAAAWRRPKPWRPDAYTAAVLVLLAGHTAMAVLFAMAGRPVVAPGRFSAPLVVPFGLAIASLSGAAPAGRALAAGLAATGLLAASLQLARPPVTGIRPEALAAEVLARNLRGPALVVTVGLSGVPLRFALRGRPDVTFRSFPVEIDRHIGWWSPRKHLAGIDALRGEADALASEADRMAAAGGQVFVEGGDSPVAAPLREALSPRFRSRPLNRLLQGLVELIPVEAPAARTPP